MSVGNHLIDMDHRLLICKINLVECALQSPGEEAAHLRLALDELEQYTVEHFDREERIQLAIDYTSYGDHKYLHQGLVKRLQEIKQGILGIEDRERLVEESSGIVELLRDWLLVHVLKEDMKMRPFLQKYPRHFAPQGL
ncbi:MAG: hemerythrin domain-containing protein [Candidatus Thiodiazotropha sp. (ex Monitilora ramsayi)]|nr:hemerythrin domain-containing protein [Candidatus Thiodiazotropha sp. (ex Monitilora ramsayi)]